MIIASVSVGSMEPPSTEPAREGGGGIPDALHWTGSAHLGNMFSFLHWSHWDTSVDHSDSSHVVLGFRAHCEVEEIACSAKPGMPVMKLDCTSL